MITVIIIGSCILTALIGFVLGKEHCSKPIGTLRIDQSDPDEAPYLFLELSEDPRELMKSTYVTLRVNAESYISQK